MSVSRRDVLKSLSMGAAATSVLRVIPLQAAEYAHHMITTEKAASKTGVYTPKFFPPAAVQDSAGIMRDDFSGGCGFGGRHRGGSSGVYRPAYQREYGIPVEARRRPYVARFRMYRSIMARHTWIARRSNRRRCWIASRIARTSRRMRAWARGLSSSSFCAR